MPLFTNWLEPLHGFMTGILPDRRVEDGYDRFARVEYGREHPDFQRVIAERMRSKQKKRK